VREARDLARNADADWFRHRVSQISGRCPTLMWLGFEIGKADPRTSHGNCGATRQIPRPSHTPALSPDGTDDDNAILA